MRWHLRAFYERLAFRFFSLVLALAPAGLYLGRWAPAVGLGLLLLFFWKLAFTNLIFAGGDTFLYFYPYWEYRARILLTGQLPLWNPYLFMGAPFLANSQAGGLYPLNWPLIFFAAPVAVKVSILLHLLIAGGGAYGFARRALRQAPLAALLAAVLFALGGYLTSQVEHVNQLQGLAWFPWLLWTIQAAGRGRGGLACWLPPALILALQLLAGHTQSTFISLVGVGLYVGVEWLRIAWADRPPGRRAALAHFTRRLVGGGLPLAGVLLLAAGLAAAQLLPMLELSRESLRSGGLDWREAVSFSVSPLWLGRALLPGYTRPMFSEFTAYVGLVGLGLAWGGIQRKAHRLALLVLVLVGLTFALGAYNPLYSLLAYWPPFNLFRVPARWLFLFAFGAAMLAGFGLERLVLEGLRPGTAIPRRLGDWLWRLLPLGFGLGLVGLTFLSARLTLPGETGPVGFPTVKDLAGWLAPLAGLGILTWVRLPARLRQWGAFFLVVGELFGASQVLSYNQLTTPEAYASVRPAMTQFLAATGFTPPGRFLSMSALRFDPGDLAELQAELNPQLPPAAVYTALIATKHKEVLSPNLPLAWGIYAVDGYDGGVLPLRHYARFAQLFTGALSTDGRLRENLTAVPPPNLLSLVNARYLVTDKVQDAWVNGVFYDLQFTLTLTDGAEARLAYVPPFQATALALMTEAPSGRVRFTFADGSTADWPIRSNRVEFDRPAVPVTITLVGPLTMRGLSLIDARSQAFQTLTLGPYRLVHSGDVKIYENLAVLPRAFVASTAVVIPDDTAALAALAEPGFDPAAQVIFPEAPPLIDISLPVAEQVVTVTAYSPEQVDLTAAGPGYLVLTDAYYPGWQATVAGRPAPILRADVMFRAVYLPSGRHTVTFRFKPLSVTVGLWLSGLAAALWLGSAGWAAAKSRTGR